MVVCAVNGCINSFRLVKNKSEVKFFRFPAKTEVANLWVKLCGTKRFINLKTARICSEHFCDNDWRLEDKLLNIPLEKRRLKTDAVPSRNLINMPPSPSAREKRARKRTREELVNQAIEMLVIKVCLEIII